MSVAQVLTIAGSDSGGGAGIQADLKTFQMRKVFGTSVLTAITAQNTLGVSAVHVLPTDIITSQIHAIREDFQITAFKLGMLANVEIIECVAENISQGGLGKMVLDPVMVAKGGAALLAASAVEAMQRYLLPYADVLTPNLPEVQALTGVLVQNRQDAEYAAKLLQEKGVKTVVIKGGHLNDSHSAECIDWVLSEEGEWMELTCPRYPTQHTHGTGCTFSACVVAELAKGVNVIAAIQTAKAFITAAIAQPLNIGSGHGPVNHWAYHDDDMF